MNAFDATVAAYAEVGRDLWTDVKDCASLGLAFVSPDEVCLALPADQLEELSFPPEASAPASGRVPVCVVGRRTAAGTGPPGSAVCQQRFYACGLAAFFARPAGACFSH